MSVITFEDIYDAWVHQALHFSAVTCLFYDHLITFGTEIDCIWRAKKNLSTMLFFLHRYLAVATNILLLIPSFDQLTEDESGAKRCGSF
uniref:DUF6533 domain-containing protein n=1 Tax=Psilocybe cubensis TaxID=181762 RepID=A0A8H8CNZ9_PSICU